ncbi:P-type conjugative transfer protein TrbL [Mesorhizobium loti]|nr:P-type conjugative transfer protein TrbL [Mesorhizobium loti]PLP60807.1 P-type conjugative transfer protein TrbL [Mesorhizobium loti]
MGGAGVIDNFLSVFTRYIDSGFGLLGGEVAFIASTLIVLDITLASLFWSLGADNDIVMRLVKKTLFVGVFAYLISNWNTLAKIVFDSFAGLGLKASGTGFTTAELMRPGKVAQTGLDAARPLLQSISDLMGWVAFFENFIQIACLLFAWALVILAFFILAIQLFVTLIEFKLATLAGFVLIPFGLFGKTAFMAERVLGNVVSSGIKVLVLAVIIGIGSTLFGQFTQGFGGVTPSIDDAMAVVLAALSLVGLGIFGPGIANGLVSGGPQLGAGAVAGTGLAVAGAAVGAGGAAALGVRAAGAAMDGGLGATGTAAAAAGAVSTAYRLGSTGQAGGSAIAAGLGGVAHAAGTVAASPLRRAADAIASRFSDGVRAGFAATGGSSNAGSVAATAAADDSLAAATSAQLRGEAPDWARRMKHAQAMSHGVSAAAHAVRSGDSHGSGTSVNLSESEGS